MITAKEFDTRFDNGENISQFLDVSNMMSVEEFEKKQNLKKIEINLPNGIIKKLEQEAKKINKNIETLIQNLIFEKLKQIA